MTLWRELPHPRLRNGKNKRSINKGKNLMVKLEIGVYSYIKFFIIFSFVLFSPSCIVGSSALCFYSICGYIRGFYLLILLSYSRFNNKRI